MKTLIGLSVCVLVFKLFFIGQANPLADEAYYWFWSEHLQFGYPEHPPILAFVMRIFTALFGQNIFGVRMVGWILWFLLSLWGYRIGREAQNHETGLLLAMTFLLIPFFWGISVIITTDTVMMFFLFPSVWYFYKAFFVSERYFLHAGVLLGLALMSKVSAGALGGVMVSYVLVSSRRKQLLRSWHLYGGLLLAGMICVPFVLWNVMNGMPLYGQLKYLMSKDGSIRSFLEFWLVQPLGYMPFWFVLMIGVSLKACWRGMKDRTARQQPAFFWSYLSVPLGLYLLAKSALNQLEPNWALIGFVGMVYGAVFWAGERLHKRWVRLCVILNHGLSAAMLMGLMGHALWTYSPLLREGDQTNRYHRYNFIEDSFLSYYRLEMDPQYRVISVGYQLPSLLNVTLKPSIEASVFNPKASYHLTLYDLLHSKDAWIGKTFYYLGEVKAHRTGEEKESIPRELRGRFEDVIFLRSFESYRGKRVISTFHLYLLKRYQGGLYKGKTIGFL